MGRRIFSFILRFQILIGLIAVFGACILFSPVRQRPKIVTVEGHHHLVALQDGREIFVPLVVRVGMI